MKPHLDDNQARQVANWLYVVEAYLPFGEHIHQHLQLALFRYSEGKEPRAVAEEIERSLEDVHS